jgi:hypothetical protein
LASNDAFTRPPFRHPRNCGRGFVVEQRVAARNDKPDHGLTAMYEIIDSLEPCKQGIFPYPLMDDSSSPEAGGVSAAFAGGSELWRQNLCAELTTLNHYGLGGVGCALVDELFALAVRSRRAVRTIRGSVAD